MAANILGMGVGMLGTAFENAGLDVAAEACNTLATVLTTVGSAVMMVGTLMSVLGPIVKGLIPAIITATSANTAEAASWYGKAAAVFTFNGAISPALAATLFLVAAIAALVAVGLILVLIFKAIKNASPEEKLRKAEVAAEQAGEAADKAAEEYKELKSSLDGLDDKYKNIENLTMYTDEWKEAVKGVNDEVLDLMTKYPELAKYVKSVNGVLTLDTDSNDVQAVIDKYEQISNYARASDYGA
jgi:hypothetical protein